METGSKNMSWWRNEICRHFNACEISHNFCFHKGSLWGACHTAMCMYVCVCVCSRGDCGSLLWTQGHEVTLNHWILTDSLAVFLQGITPPLRVTVNVYRVHQQGLQHTPEKSLLNITQPLKAFNRDVTQAQHNLSVPNSQ